VTTLRSPHPPPLVRGALGLAIIAALCGSSAAPAHAADARTEFGMALRGLFGVGDFADLAAPSLGADFSFDVVNAAGGLGLRAVAGLNMLPTEEMTTSGTFIVWPVTATITTAQDIMWIAAGPVWSIPRPVGRTDVYLMGGMATADASWDGGTISTTGTEPTSTSTSTWIAIAGAMWVVPVRNEGLKVEVGGELQFGGLGTFWDRPAILPDGAGGYSYRTRGAAIEGFALRLGLGYQRQPRKR
jgi:hypothetical protein